VYMTHPFYGVRTWTSFVSLHFFEPVRPSSFKSIRALTLSCQRIPSSSRGEKAC
jgi:hypothetical protein